MPAPMMTMSQMRLNFTAVGHGTNVHPENMKIALRVMVSTVSTQLFLGQENAECAEECRQLTPEIPVPVSVRIICRPVTLYSAYNTTGSARCTPTLIRDVQ